MERIRAAHRATERDPDGRLNFTPRTTPRTRTPGRTAENWGYGRLVQPDGFVDTWTAAGNREEDGPTLYRD